MALKLKNRAPAPIEDRSMLGSRPTPLDAQSVGATSRVPRLDPVGADGAAPRARPLIDGKKNPIAAWGAILQNIGRGIAGQPLYTDELKAQRAEEDALAFKKIEVGGQWLTKGMELLKNTPAEKRPMIAKAYGAMVEGALPGFTGVMEMAAERPDVTQAMLDVMGEHGKTFLTMAGGDVDEAMQLAQKPELVKLADSQADRRNAPEITRAFQRAKDLLAGAPGGNEALAKASADGWTLTDIQDPAVMEAIGLTQSHVNSIARSKDIQESLRTFDFVPGIDLTLQAKQKIEEKPLSRIAAEAATQAAAKEGEKIVPFVGADGTIRREPQKFREQMASMGFSPLQTGRTAEDLTATDKALAKDTAGKAVPVDPHFAKLTGLNVTTTKQEAITAGYTPDISEASKSALEKKELNTDNLRGIIGQARAVIQQNPDANTRTAGLQRLATNLRAEVEAFGRGAGIKIDFDREIEAHKDVWKQTGIDNALMQQYVISIAYMGAKNLDEGGRLSDADVRLSAKANGGTNADPDILLSSLDQVELTTENSFRNQVKATYGKLPPSALPDIQDSESIAERFHAGEPITRDEIKSLSPRARRHYATLLDKRPAKKK